MRFVEYGGFKRRSNGIYSERFNEYELYADSYLQIAVNGAECGDTFLRNDSNIKIYSEVQEKSALKQGIYIWNNMIFL